MSGREPAHRTIYENPAQRLAEAVAAQSRCVLCDGEQLGRDVVCERSCASGRWRTRALIRETSAGRLAGQLVDAAGPSSLSVRTARALAGYGARAGTSVYQTYKSANGFSLPRPASFRARPRNQQLKFKLLML